MNVQHDSRQKPVDRRLRPCAEIVLGTMSRERLIESVWDQASTYARGMLKHREFFIHSAPQKKVGLVALGADAFLENVPMEDIEAGRLFDRGYMAAWSGRELDGQLVIPCQAEDAVQLWAQHLASIPPDTDDLFGSHRPWSSMAPLPRPFGMRFVLVRAMPDRSGPLADITRGIGANQYGVGTDSPTNIFHNRGGSILYRLMEL